MQNPNGPQVMPPQAAPQQTQGNPTTAQQQQSLHVNLNNQTGALGQTSPNEQQQNPGNMQQPPPNPQNYYASQSPTSQSQNDGGKYMGNSGNMPPPGNSAVNPYLQQNGYVNQQQQQQQQLHQTNQPEAYTQQPPGGGGQPANWSRSNTLSYTSSTMQPHHTGYCKDSHIFLDYKFLKIVLICRGWSTNAR